MLLGIFIGIGIIVLSIAAAALVGRAFGNQHHAYPIIPDGSNPHRLSEIGRPRPMKGNVVSVKYALFEVGIHGLDALTLQDVEDRLRNALVAEFQPQFDNQIEIELLESAGKEEK
jgi:hypothetical protein